MKNSISNSGNGAAKRYENVRNPIYRFAVANSGVSVVHSKDIDTGSLSYMTLSPRDGALNAKQGAQVTMALPCRFKSVTYVNALPVNERIVAVGGEKVNGIALGGLLSYDEHAELHDFLANKNWLTEAVKTAYGKRTDVRVQAKSLTVGDVYNAADAVSDSMGVRPASGSHLRAVLRCILVEAVRFSIGDSAVDAVVKVSQKASVYKAPTLDEVRNALFNNAQSAALHGLLTDMKSVAIVDAHSSPSNIASRYYNAIFNYSLKMVQVTALLRTLNDSLWAARNVMLHDSAELGKAEYLALHESALVQLIVGDWSLSQLAMNGQLQASSDLIHRLHTVRDDASAIVKGFLSSRGLLHRQLGSLKSAHNVSGEQGLRIATTVKPMLRDVAVVWGIPSLYDPTYSRVVADQVETDVFARSSFATAVRDVFAGSWTRAADHAANVTSLLNDVFNVDEARIGRITVVGDTISIFETALEAGASHLYWNKADPSVEYGNHMSDFYPYDASATSYGDRYVPVLVLNNAALDQHFAERTMLSGETAYPDVAYAHVMRIRGGAGTTMVFNMNGSDMLEPADLEYVGNAIVKADAPAYNNVIVKDSFVYDSHTVDVSFPLFPNYVKAMNNRFLLTPWVLKNALSVYADLVTLMLSTRLDVSSTAHVDPKTGKSAATKDSLTRVAKEVEKQSLRSAMTAFTPWLKHPFVLEFVRTYTRQVALSSTYRTRFANKEQYNMLDGEIIWRAFFLAIHYYFQVMGEPTSLFVTSYNALNVGRSLTEIKDLSQNDELFTVLSKFHGRDSAVTSLIAALDAKVPYIRGLNMHDY